MKRNKNKDAKKVAKDLLIPMIIAAIIVFIFTRFFGIGFVEGVSMKPTYHNGQIFLYNKSVKDLEDGDIVVFKSKELKSDLVKRVIAIQNEKLELKGGNVYVDGVLINEDYIKEKDNATNISVVIPRGYVFVMGDNRNHSIDSRSFGLIKETDIYGKVF